MFGKIEGDHKNKYDILTFIIYFNHEAATEGYFLYTIVNY